MIAVPISAIVTPVAFLHPNSDAIASILARHGMYIMLTNANTINCTGVIIEPKFVVWKITANVNRVISFLTIPNINNIPDTAGNPSHQTVIGISALLIGVSTPNAYNACTAALPIM